MSATQSPASLPETRKQAAEIIPMDVPVLSLGVVDIPGFHCHWFLGKNVPRARMAGYTHVTREDGVEVANTGLADSKFDEGGTDMGTNISVIAGTDIDPLDGQAERLYLMKLPQEEWDKVQASRDAKNERIASALRSGITGADTDPDVAKRYLKEGQRLFIPKR